MRRIVLTLLIGSAACLVSVVAGQPKTVPNTMQSKVIAQNCCDDPPPPCWPGPPCPDGAPAGGR